LGNAQRRGGGLTKIKKGERVKDSALREGGGVIRRGSVAGKNLSIGHKKSNTNKEGGAREIPQEKGGPQRRFRRLT